MTLDQLLLILLVGLVAGFLATHLIAGHGYGLLGDIVVGVLGALLGNVLLGNFLALHVLTPLGIAAGSVLGQVFIALVGAAILIAALRLVTGRGWVGPGYTGRRRPL
jgi:uncharacterized membrane protein YeaQ/YmgE (transglycosylase-associated protein family)